MLSPMSRFGGPVRTAVDALREAMANDGIRRLGTFLAAISGPSAAAVTERIAAANLGRSEAVGVAGAAG
jgi:hypothetical protein